MYKMIKREYALTPDEQEQAKFILNNCDKLNAKIARGDVTPVPERNAFEIFKMQFYKNVWYRLFGLTGIIPAMDIGDEGNKIIWISIEKV